MKKLFLDMDGLLVDFVGGACRAHKRPNPYVFPENFGDDDGWTSALREYQNACGKYLIHELWGISEEQFWMPLQGSYFWHHLEPTPEAKFIVDAGNSLFGKENVYLLSKPCLDSDCPRGKIEWIEDHFPALKERYIFTANKEAIAHEEAFLVDDSDSVVKKFRVAGGHAFLFPRAWNSEHKISLVSNTSLTSMIAMLATYLRAPYATYSQG